MGIGADHDVFGFDVPMHQLVGMGNRKRFCYLLDNLQGASPGKASFCREERPQRAARHGIHDDVVNV